MKLPIVAYGHEILRKQCSDIGPGHPDLAGTLESMWETLYGARGCGLAAPQVNLPYRIFLVDSTESYEDMDEEDRADFFEGDTGIKQEFINARITGYSEETWLDEEGCLSIPSMTADVERPWSITIEYSDRDFRRHTKTFSGLTARMIQHEYDHTEGILYLDHLSKISLLTKNKLKKISAGQVKVNYPMKFPRP